MKQNNTANFEIVKKLKDEPYEFLKLLLKQEI